ncbi:MAG TPA: MarR family transcriptional regulator [Stellaceae bacterium]|jgi:DNA-binding MarR family transcriptional regulator|nr:MarR family transcriptional regulator [Stellaceae bacterium]
MAPPSDPSRVVPLMPSSSLPSPHDAAAVRPDPAVLQANVGALLHDVARLIRRRFERRARQTGLPITRQQARALLHIARNEGLSQAAVATMLDVEPIALVRLLDRLHEEGLVERHAHPTDRRVRTLWLTPVAWDVIDRILAINREVREETCAGLSAAEREMLMAALGHMKSNLVLAEETESAAAE